MKAKLLLRIASGCILFFAVGHSMGHFTRKVTTDSQIQEVFRQMETVKVNLHGALRSYDEFFDGMSINLIITLAALAVLLWLLANASVVAPKTTYTMLWPVLLCITAFAVTSFVYFFLVPGVTCVVAAVLILMALNSLRTEK